MSKLGLGKGLSSLLGSEEGKTFGATSEEIAKVDASTLKITEIEPNKDQPRKVFDQEALQQLADSIKEHGVISPIIVREMGEKYQIIAGERRYRACKMLNMREIPVKVMNLADKEVAEIALIENLQREDLNPLEEALGYKELMNTYKMTQEQVAKSIGKSRSAISNITRILTLEQPILDMIERLEISSGHAKAILSVDDTTKRVEFAQFIIDENLNVRQAENFAKKLNQGGETPKKADKIEVSYELQELKMQDSLCRKVKIMANKNHTKGKVMMEYCSNEDLEKLIDALSKISM